MKHAGASTLDKLEPCLSKLRERGRLRERKRGIFYRGSAAFLHFHEDTTGVYADVRGPEGNFDRYRANDANEQERLLDIVDARLTE